MYISKIIIKNFRNFDEFSMPLKPFTTIIGENNIGKSNLIEAISLLLSNDLSIYKKRSLSVEDFNFKCIEKFKKSLIECDVQNIELPEIRIDLFISNPTLEQEAILESWWYNYDEKIARISYVYRHKSLKKNEFLLRQKEILKGKEADDSILSYIDLPIENYEYEILGGLADVKVDNYYLKMLKMNYLDALRDSKRELSSKGENKLLYKILADREMEKFGDIKEKVVELEDIIKEDKEVLSSLKTMISDYLNKISMETETSSNNINFSFTSIELSEILKKIGIQYGDEAISIDRNGLGRNNLLYIAVNLAHLFEKEDFFRLSVIEEPEAHLTPVLQKHLAKSLENENSEDQQVIVTTHSTHVGSFLDLDNTVILYKHQNTLQFHYLLEGFNLCKSEDKKTVRYLQKWLNATNSTLFFTRNIIFVEGIAEEILLPIFYEWEYGKTLEKVNCQIVNVNGVAFRNFLKLIKNGYFIKCGVLTDSDATKKTSERASELKTSFDSDNILVSITNNEDTFEKEIFYINNKIKANRKLLLNVMEKVRPIKCDSTFKKEREEKAYEVEDMFNLIEKFKSEFAFELSDELKGKIKNENKHFKIPQYILDVFKFINNEEQS